MSVVMAKMRWITMHCADAMNTQLGSECRQQQSECIYNKKKKSPSTATIKGGGGGFIKGGMAKHELCGTKIEVTTENNTRG